MTQHPDELRPLTDLEVRVLEARGDAQRQDMHKLRNDRLEGILQGIATAQTFLKQHRLTGGHPVYVSRFPAYITDVPLGGIEHSGVVLSGRDDQVVLMTDFQQHVVLTNLTHLGHVLVQGHTAQEIGWRAIQTSADFQSTMQLYKARKTLGLLQWVVPAIFGLLICIYVFMAITSHPTTTFSEGFHLVFVTTAAMLVVGGTLYGLLFGLIFLAIRNLDTRIRVAARNVFVLGQRDEQ